MSDSMLANLLCDNPIVVTGAGSFSAAGDSVEALWSAAIAGQSLAVWREFELEAKRARFAVCSAPELDGLLSGLLTLRKMDRCVQMAWLAANQARNQAHLANAYSPARVGIIVGSSRGPLGKRAESFGHHGRHKYPPSLSAQNTFACISGALAQAFKLKGPGAVVSATCASAAFAVGLAAEQILLGKADAMIVGGTEAPLHFAVLAQLHSAGVLGFHEEAPQTCRPFDATRNGTVVGEGSGFLILESARTAAARGVAACARLTGWAFSLDDSGRAGVHEDGSGLLQVMQQALQIAGLAAEQIDYINAHGTGTKMNDAGEACAVKTLLGDRVATVPCSSTKPVTGHCLGATPALEAVLCVEALRRQQIPPTANCLQPDPLCPINPLPTKAQPARLTNVMSNSLGFWGFHAALIFSKVR
ncbi:MAG: beta-ketoacyl-[acyl-carrier-protein] synthase family protein [Verrucomicrobiota bacterium]